VDARMAEFSVGALFLAGFFCEKWGPVQLIFRKRGP
jgi:hypothetical protein